MNQSTKCMPLSTIKQSINQSIKQTMKTINPSRIQTKKKRVISKSNKKQSKSPSNYIVQCHQSKHLARQPIKLINQTKRHSIRQTSAAKCKSFNEFNFFMKTHIICCRTVIRVFYGSFDRFLLLGCYTFLHRTNSDKTHLFVHDHL